MDFYKVLDQTVRDIKREVNKKVLKVPEIEQKVLDATSNEPWGPHGTLMAEIAQATRNFNESQMVMDVLWRRIGDTGKDWRHVYKALTVLEYLVANGSERIIDELSEHTFQISTLSDFQFIEPNGKDQGINVRKKAQNILALINDKNKIREVRQKASANRAKYGGLSSTGGYKPSSYSSFGGGFDGDRYDDDRFGSQNGGKYDDSDKQRNSDQVQDRYDQGRSDKTADSYGDDDFARIRDHDDDRTEGNTAKVSNLSQNQAATSVTQIGAMDSADDDFDPRGSSKPVAAPPITTFIDDDVFGQSSAGKHSDIMKVVPPPPPSAGNVPISASVGAPSSAIDLFADASFNATFVVPSPSTTYSLNKSPFGTLFPPSEDLFAAQTSNTASSATSGINEGLSMFEATPSKSNGTNNGFGNADPFDGFGDFVTSKTSEHTSIPENQSQPLPPKLAQHSNTAGAAKSQQQKEKFEPKSSIWADSLSRGIIDLNISAPKNVNLSDIGITLDFPTSEKKVEERKTYTFSKGKAMGSGSGLGLAGASTLAASASTTMGAYNMGVGSGAGVNVMTPGAGVNVMGMGPSVSMLQNPGSGFATNFTMGTGQGGFSSQQRQFGEFR